MLLTVFQKSNPSSDGVASKRQGWWQRLLSSKSSIFFLGIATSALTYTLIPSVDHYLQLYQAKSILQSGSANERDTFPFIRNGNAAEYLIRHGVPLAEMDFGGFNFSSAKLREGNFRDSDFSGATLHNTDLFRVNLSGANLAGAVFILGRSHDSKS
ncbi:pentapeptide repeat-containing protein [Almyronema epifaneia]|uniref:Pentapeptide repeat-containing protein n=1 Tax=Almyronema epifaneia S1 TaxID=2991925 RepID=A0ABW6IER6_9CYAN